jgi:hypothetical protein
MSPEENEIVEIEKSELTEEKIASLVNEILRNKEKYAIESKLILVLELEERYTGCGYVYLWGDRIKIIGSADTIILEEKDTYDCLSRSRIAIIPKMVPTIVLKHHYDDAPGTRNTLTLYVFDGSSWNSMIINVPKDFSLSLLDEY